MKRSLLLVLILLLSLTVQTTGLQQDYSPAIQPSPFVTPVITWDVAVAPSWPVALFWSGSGTWLAHNNSVMTLEIESIGEDVAARISLGNATWGANDTDLARDLAIGVWGLTPWLPGFVIPIGEASISELNQTAYASANRSLGNYMNGTMYSYYDSVLVGGGSYDCIVFRYEQDETPYGEPQHTELAYDLATGILITGSTNYSLGTPYVMTFSLASMTNPRAYVLLGFVVVAASAVGLVVVVRVRSRKLSP